jgi:hypothetical protein
MNQLYDFIEALVNLADIYEEPIVSQWRERAPIVVYPGDNAFDRYREAMTYV